MQVTSGCSHNAFKFCNYYKDAKFSVSPIEEIKIDLQEIKDSGYIFSRIFLQGADSFILKQMMVIYSTYEQSHFVSNRFDTSV